MKPNSYSWYPKNPLKVCKLGLCVNPVSGLSEPYLNYLFSFILAGEQLCRNSFLLIGNAA